MLKSAIASFSLGRSVAGHDLLTKAREAGRAGYSGIEIFFECLEHLAAQKRAAHTHASRETSLLDAAQDVRTVCDEVGIEILVLLPFAFYDGLVDREAHKKKLDELELWFKLCHILKADLIQIPTNFQPEGTTGDLEKIAADMAILADLGLQESPPIRFAYEAISWGNHIDLWEETWEVVKRADRPNLGLCLDTFHIAGRVWADPSVESGRNPDAKEALDRSMELLLNDVDPAKIFYVQLSDAAQMEPPLDHKHPLFTEGQKPRMTWSRSVRLFPFEYDRGAYLPIDQIMDTIFNQMQWEGWVSMEVFHQELYEEREQLPAEFGQRGRTAWAAFQKRIAEGAAT